MENLSAMKLSVEEVMKYLGYGLYRDAKIEGDEYITEMIVSEDSIVIVLGEK